MLDVSGELGRTAGIDAIPDHNGRIFFDRSTARGTIFARLIRLLAAITFFTQGSDDIRNDFTGSFEQNLVANADIFSAMKSKLCKVACFTITPPIATVEQRQWRQGTVDRH